MFEDSGWWLLIIGFAAAIEAVVQAWTTNWLEQRQAERADREEEEEEEGENTPKESISKEKDQGDRELIKAIEALESRLSDRLDEFEQRLPAKRKSRAPADKDK